MRKGSLSFFIVYAIAPQSFRSWICRIALNLAHEHYSASKRRAQVMEPMDETVCEQMVALEPAQAEENIRRQQMLKQVYKALPQLTPRERSVFVLKTIEGMENDEVSRLLGISETTVRRFYGLARRKILETIQLEGLSFEQKEQKEGIT